MNNWELFRHKVYVNWGKGPLPKVWQGGPVAEWHPKGDATRHPMKLQIDIVKGREGGKNRRRRRRKMQAWRLDSKTVGKNLETEPNGEVWILRVLCI